MFVGTVDLSIIFDIILVDVGCGCLAVTVSRVGVCFVCRRPLRRMSRVQSPEASSSSDDSCALHRRRVFCDLAASILRDFVMTSSGRVRSDMDSFYDMPEFDLPDNSKFVVVTHYVCCADVVQLVLPFLKMLWALCSLMWRCCNLNWISCCQLRSISRCCQCIA